MSYCDQCAKLLHDNAALSSRCESLQAEMAKVREVANFWIDEHVKETERRCAAERAFEDLRKADQESLTEALAAAIEQMKRAETAEAALARERELHRWRDVKQELPPKNEAVDVAHWVEGTGVFTRELHGWHVWIAKYNDGWKRADGASADPVFHGDVRLWRPRPEPPALLEPHLSSPKPATEETK